MKKLYVDHLADEGFTGVVENKTKIIYNLETVRPGLKEETLQLLTKQDTFSRALIAGRFVCLTTFSLTDRAMMVILNLKRESAALEDLLTDIKHPEFRQFVIDAFNALNVDDSGY
jgi:hypothetical protein